MKVQRRNFFEVNFTLPFDETQKFHKWINVLEKKEWDVGLFEDGEFKSLNSDELLEKAREILDEEETDSDISYNFVAAKIITAVEEDEFELARDEALAWLEGRDQENGWEVTWIDEEEFEEEVDDEVNDEGNDEEETDDDDDDDDEDGEEE